MAADERRAGDTLSALAQRRAGARAPGAWWPPPCAGCTISIRLPVPSTIAWNGVWTPCASGSRPGWWTRRTSMTTIAVAAPRSCTACSSTGVRRSKTWWSPTATPARPTSWRRGGASAASSIAGGSASPTGTRTWPWPRGTSRPNSARPAEAFLVEYGGDIDGERLAYFRLLDEFFRVGPVRGRTGFGLPLHENEVQRHRPLSPPRALARSAESPVQFSRYCASSFAESTRIRLGSVLCMACTKVLGISISRK